MSYYFRHLNYAKYFRHLQKIKHCLCLKPFSVLIYGKFNSNYFLHFSFCLVFKLYKSSLQILQFISSHLIFLGRVDIGVLLIVALFERWILTLAHFSDVFSDLETIHVRPVYHSIFWAGTMFYLSVFSIDIHNKCKSNHDLLLLVIFQEWHNSGL